MTPTTYAISPEWGWQALMLPQMDAQNTALNFTTTKGAASNAQSLLMKVSSYICPSANVQGAGIGYSTYRGCVGTKRDDTTTNPGNLIAADGAFFMNSAVSDRFIKDGTTSTIMFGESQFGFWGDALSCCARVGYPYAYTSTGGTSVPAETRPLDWIGPNSPPTPQATSSGSTVDVVTGTQTSNAIYMYFGFGSPHADSCNFALADGSARPITKSIDPKIFSALATIAGYEKISDDF
jgi:prepilin-type processing-associated H-X9-DG protein